MNREDRRHTFRVLSTCLSYPEAGTEAELVQAVGAVGDESVRRRLEEFLRQLAEVPLLVRQERYTETFDLSSALCLNLTAHGFQAGEQRGRALCGLLALYRESGWEPAGGELPDFLPLLLEFLSLAPEAAACREVAILGTALAGLEAALRKRRSPYAIPLEILRELLPAPVVPDDGGASRERKTP